MAMTVLAVLTITLRYCITDLLLTEIWILREYILRLISGLLHLRTLLILFLQLVYIQ